jgi:KUP system potassium uptake protein
MKKSNINSDRITIASLLVALGIIYGDIGTSPLYVLKAIVGERLTFTIYKIITF